MKTRAILAAVLGAASVGWAGCGDDAIGPAVERNDPGTGTRTLLVMAEIEARDVSGGFVTDFEVNLRDSQGRPISGATVTIRNGDVGTLNLLEVDAGSGDYVATVNRFGSGDYRLDAVQGEHKVQGVVVGGIAGHTITSPGANGTVLAGQPLQITWSRSTEAAGADVETRDFGVEGVPDTGSFSVPADQNPARTDQRIRVWRYNRVDIAGGLFGSRLKLSIRNTVEPVVVQ